ncbi:amidohydrolase family protein [Bradyrhizobium liaoningense]|uniref:amidohydrolase family protein n=1 Tax=Bradyrhizobium liaoningense TaxID=43992 RepID=UPI001BA6EC24|nr:amidohydrolase family protein [Bradyrhizobium liaoningense]MBR0844155.1 amidohydrolase family protein [Bradyrhizobium liaoningense]
MSGETATRRDGNAWCLRNIRYYDSESGQIRLGDIEVVGTRIGAIVKAGTSGLRPVTHDPNTLCLPGLINAHLHPSKELYGGFSDSASIASVLDMIHRNYDVETKEIQKTSSRYSLVRALETGVTTVGIFSSRAETDAELVESLGMRAVIHYCQNDQWVGSGTKPSFDTIDSILSRIAACALRFDSDRITICPATASERSATTSLLSELHGLAASWKRRFAIHVHEGATQVAACREHFARTGIALLRDLSLLDEHCLLVHACCLSPDDLDVLMGSAASVVHCPVGNSFVGAGKLPLARLIRSRPIGLGTDAAIVNPVNHLPFEGLFALYFHGEADLSDKVSARDIFDMMTAQGARALGLDDVGAIKPGFQADFGLYRCPWLKEPGRIAALTVLQTLLLERPCTVVVGGSVLVGREGIRSLSRGDEEFFQAQHLVKRAADAGYAG